MGGRISIAWLPVAEIGAAVALGGACAFGAANLLLVNGVGSAAAPLTALTSLVVSLLTHAVLDRFGQGARHAVAGFELDSMPVPEADEAAAGDLLLTDAERLSGDCPETPGDAEAGELLLDDILAELRPDARVVRLFDVNAMPTPGQLQASIDRHLSSADSRSAPPDASDALHDALAELRRSLR
jgi:hypothetical protein